MEDQKSIVKPIPEGYHTATPFLMVDNVKEQIEFLKNAFNAEEFENLAAQDGTIMHAEVKIGDSVIMIGPTKEAANPIQCMIYLYVENADELYKQAIEAGATSIMEPTDQFYGDRSGGLKDPAGNIWWVATHIENLSLDEIRDRAANMEK